MGVFVILGLALLLLNLGAVGAFTTIVADRASQVGVASNSNALVGLDVAPSVQSGSQERLVTITNNLGEEATFTVTLDESSDGTLYAGGTSATKSIDVTLAPGESADVDLKGSAGSSGGQSCSSSSDKNTNAVPGFDVIYYCHVYDSANDETTYVYKVVADDDSDEDEEDDEDGNGGGPPGKKGGSGAKDVSHTVFGVPDNSFSDGDVVATDPAAYSETKIDTADPTTGVTGVKFDQEVKTDDGCGIYHYTLDGEHGEGDVTIGVKAGSNEYTFGLTGPSAGAGSGSGSETVEFSVTASAASSTVDVKSLQSTITTGSSSKSVSNVPACSTDDGDDEEDDD